MTYVYFLLDPRPGFAGVLTWGMEVRYVGVARDPGARYLEHLNEDTDTYKCRWVQKLLAMDLQPAGFVVALVESDEEAKRMEVALIARMRARVVRLTNSTDGGEGTTGYQYTPEQRAKMSKPLSEGHRAKISAGLKGKTQSASHSAALKAACARPKVKAKHSAALKAMWERPEYREKMSVAKKAAWDQPGVRARQSDAMEAAWKRSHPDAFTLDTLPRAELALEE